MRITTKSGLPTCSIRPFNVYGPGQIGGGAIRAFIETVLAGEDLIIHGDGPQIRAWCYVDDLVDALLLVLERPEAVGEVFNVGNERSVLTVLELATQIRDLMSLRGRDQVPALHYTDVEMRIPNVDKARKLLGWEAKVDLDAGLSRTIAWYRNASRHRRDPARVAGPREEEPAAVAEVLESGQLTMGPKVAEFEDEPRAPVRSSTPWLSPRGRLRSILQCSPSGSGRATR